MRPDGLLSFMSEKKKEINVYEKIEEVIQETKEIEQEYNSIKNSKHISYDIKIQLLKDLKDSFNEAKEELHDLIDRLQIKEI